MGKRKRERERERERECVWGGGGQRKKKVEILTVREFGTAGSGRILACTEDSHACYIFCKKRKVCPF